MEVINLRRLSEWAVCEPGEAISLPGIARDIEISFATAGPTPMFITENGRTFPLGIVNGTVMYKFRVGGDVQIIPTSEDTLAYRTLDGAITAIITAPEDYHTWASDMEVVPRNFQEEWVQFTAMQNANARMEKMTRAAAADREHAAKLLSQATEMLKNAKGEPEAGGDDKAGAPKTRSSKPKADPKPPAEVGKRDQSGEGHDDEQTGH